MIDFQNPMVRDAAQRAELLVQSLNQPVEGAPADKERNDKLKRVFFLLLTLPPFALKQVYAILLDEGTVEFDNSYIDLATTSMVDIMTDSKLSVEWYQSMIDACSTAKPAPNKEEADFQAQMRWFAQTIGLGEFLQS